MQKRIGRKESMYGMGGGMGKGLYMEAPLILVHPSFCTRYSHYLTPWGWLQEDGCLVLPSVHAYMWEVAEGNEIRDGSMCVHKSTVKRRTFRLVCRIGNGTKISWKCSVQTYRGTFNSTRQAKKQKWVSNQATQKKRWRVMWFKGVFIPHWIQNLLIINSWTH